MIIKFRILAFRDLECQDNVISGFQVSGFRTRSITNQFKYQEDEYEIESLYDLMNNLLFDYDLNPNNILEIMTSNSQNIICYSSLIGYFYQHGIGCEADVTKEFEILSNAAINNQKELLVQFSFDQKIETIIFCDDDIKELNEIMT
ncbi:hypothetical protein GLOIN_2v1771610 [Rhizophagus clarus]|uniref:Uncharacterized protein n=1 Tax=Rhizophagus clarus TaxID=94130 RepID=A0A8H3QZD1_9GLOM|nr:hypothetical protein GLOIN_2v1771610 [Rhizophagus clarus]